MHSNFAPKLVNSMGALVSILKIRTWDSEGLAEAQSQQVSGHVCLLNPGPVPLFQTVLGTFWGVEC